MSLYPALLARLVQELSKLPGIGEKTAARLAFYMLKAKRDEILRLAESIGKLRQEMGLCQRCFGFSEVTAQNETKDEHGAASRNQRRLTTETRRTRRFHGEISVPSPCSPCLRGEDSLSKIVGRLSAEFRILSATCLESKYASAISRAARQCRS